MEMRSVSCTIIMLVSLAINTDARITEHALADEGLSSACDKCLMVSKKAEAVLNSQKLFDEAHKLSGEACHVFPAIYQDKCIKKSGAYLHEARHILQELFEEGHICKGTGLCATSDLPVDNCLGMNDEFDDELFEERGCITCRKGMRGLFTRLKNPKMKSKIVDALLNYCEESDEDEDQCKHTMYQYGPMFLRKLEKVKPSKMCSMIRMCDEEITMKI